MKFIQTTLPGAYIIELEPRNDERGFFVRLFCKKESSKIGHTKEFVQFNQSLTMQRGTVRGLHYQIHPAEEVKLVRCIRGQVYDVIVDLREGSPTFLQHFSVVLSEESLKMLYIPEGFAHGFQTLRDNTQMMYFHTAYYSPKNERGLLYNDPALNITWPLKVSNISEKDKNNPLININFKGIHHEV